MLNKNVKKALKSNFLPSIYITGDESMYARDIDSLDRPSATAQNH